MKSIMISFIHTQSVELATVFKLIPASDSGLEHDGQFYLGYQENQDSPTVTVNGYRVNPRSRESTLTLDTTDNEDVYPVLGLLSPYYAYYKDNGDRKLI